MRIETKRRATIAACVGLGVVGLLASCSSSDDAEVKSSNTTAPKTSTTSPATTHTTMGPKIESAAGEDCVAFADQLPTGAPDVPMTPGPPPTELVIEDLVVGTGPAVAPGATVTVDYIGTSCSTGMIFDDSYSRGQQATFGLEQVIPGWTEGLVGMQEGGERLLVIPPDMAYGSKGSPPNIQPDETLYFVVTLHETA